MTLKDGSDVTVSVDEAPVSCARAMPGAFGVVVSSVKVSAADVGETLPATSVCRTTALFGPSPAIVKLVPAPSLQVAPASRLYCQTASASNPLTSTTPEFVMPSVADVPLSACSARRGAIGGIVSTVRATTGESVLAFPAASVAVAARLWVPSARAGETND